MNTIPIIIVTLSGLFGFIVLFYQLRPKSKLIRVTEENIRKGTQGNPMRCPVARALRREFNVRRCTASHYFLDINGISIPTPEIVRNFMRRFDSGERVKPFSFRLKL